MSQWDFGDDTNDGRAAYGPRHGRSPRQLGPAYDGPPGDGAAMHDSPYSAREPDPGPSTWPDAPQDPDPVSSEWPGYAEYMPGRDPGQSGYPPAGWGGHPPAQDRAGRPRRGKNWMLGAAAAAVACLLTVAAVVVKDATTAQVAPGSHAGAAAGRGPASRTGAGSAARAAPAITRGHAEFVLNHYTGNNNAANKLRSDEALRKIEADTSLTMDIGAFRIDRVTDPSNHNYLAFGPVHVTYYIPRQSIDAAYPHWFVARVTYADKASPQRPIGAGYLLFTQDSPGAAWKDVLEPWVLPGNRTTLRIAVDAQGFATAVSPGGNAAGLGITPAQIEPVTAASLDGGSPGVIKVPRNLSDLRDQAFWQPRLGPGATVTDMHQPAPGAVFGLRTKDGGALLFYALSAQLSLAPPPGDTFQLNIPGYYSPSQTLTSAKVGYVEQFATYDPPQGKSGPRIAADISSIASRD
jgi:hypothetical protein